MDEYRPMVYQPVNFDQFKLHTHTLTSLNQSEYYGFSINRAVLEASKPLLWTIFPKIIIIHLA